MTWVIILGVMWFLLVVGIMFVVPRFEKHVHDNDLRPEDRPGNNGAR